MDSDCLRSQLVAIGLAAQAPRAPSAPGEATDAAFEQGDHRTVLRKWGTLQRAGDAPWLMKHLAPQGLMSKIVKSISTIHIADNFRLILNMSASCFHLSYLVVIRQDHNFLLEVPAQTLVQAPQMQLHAVTVMGICESCVVFSQCFFVLLDLVCCC